MRISYLLYQWFNGEKLRPYVCTSIVPEFSGEREYSVFIPYTDISHGSKRSGKYKKMFIDRLEQFGFGSDVLTVEHDKFIVLDKYDSFKGGRRKGSQITFKAKRKLEITFLVTVLRVIYEHPYSNVNLDFSKPLKPQIHEWYLKNKGSYGIGHSLYGYRPIQVFKEYSLQTLKDRIQETTGIS